MNPPAGRMIAICASTDILRARQLVTEISSAMGFGSVDQTRIATAVSEITRNVLQHSGTTGELHIDEVERGPRRGLSLVVEDRGRGIPDVPRAMADGFTTSIMSLGAGLPGARGLMDEFAVDSAVGRGTTVRMVKWLRRRG